MAARAIVLVSGGDSVTPYTSPELACGSGMAAGMTFTALREHLLAAGQSVFTAPVMNDRGQVLAPPADSFAAFGDQPLVLNEELTINSVADPDLGGEHLARFLNWLAENHNISELALVAHSNGGLFSRSAIRVLRGTGSAIKVTKLATLGTPWLGAIPTRVAVGELDASAFTSHPFFAKFLPESAARIKEGDQGLIHTNTVGYLQGPAGWNAAQKGILDDIDTLLIGGTYLQGSHPDADPTLWPNDGIVPEYSALAIDLDTAVLPQVRRLSYPVTHSIFISNLMNLDWQTAMTWNKEILTDVTNFVCK